MADLSFVVLKHQGKVPAMASCTKCQRKFFKHSDISNCVLRWGCGFMEE
jgi:hypothetical protein